MDTYVCMYRLSTSAVTRGDTNFSGYQAKIDVHIVVFKYHSKLFEISSTNQNNLKFQRLFKIILDKFTKVR